MNTSMLRRRRVRGWLRNGFGRCTTDAEEGGHVEESFQVLQKGASGGGSVAGTSGVPKERKKRAPRKKKEVPTGEAIDEEEEGATQESQTVALKFKPTPKSHKKKDMIGNTVDEEESEAAGDGASTELAPAPLPMDASLVETTTIPNVSEGVVAGEGKKRKRQLKKNFGGDDT
ncbi:hypothetical protein Dimus_030113 [Dionaea muscipula]